MFEKNINRFLLFIVLAKEKSFTKAAAKLGMSQSALSHAIKQLEESVQLRLLNRTTRSVSLSDAGERLLQIVEPKFSEIKNELLTLNEEYHHATGSIRLTTSDYATQTVLWPILKNFARKHPQINVEINIENRFIDIVTERYDAGIRFGDQIEKDMVAVRISPDVRFLVVCSPDYLEGKSGPETPEDLLAHKCINLRLNSTGGLYAWEFERENRASKIRVEGQLAFNSSTQILSAALDGFGFAYLPENLIKEYLDSGALLSVLEEWCPFEPGLYMYYPNHQQHRMAFQLLLDTLRCSSEKTTC